MAKPALGLSMLYCLDKPFEVMTKRLAKAETRHIEIVDEGLHALNERRVAALAKIRKFHDLEYSVHAPFADINIASPSKLMLKVMLERLENSLSFASDLEAYKWVFHPGMKTGISSFYPGFDWTQNIETTRDLIEMANKYGVRIAVENVPEPYPFLMKKVEDFQTFYKEINRDISMVLDVGHANINREIQSFMRTFPDRIAHMHLSDNDGTSDQHVLMGEGTVNWHNFKSWLDEMRYDKVLIVESIGRVDKDLRKLSQLLS